MKALFTKKLRTIGPRPTPPKARLATSGSLGLENYELRIKNIATLFIATIVVLSFIVFADNVEAQTESISLVWQADTYTPPLYRGKALYTGGASYQVIALPPNGRSVNNLVFTWEKDARVLGSRSGLGQNVLSLEGSVVNDRVDIRVIVSTQSGTELGRGRVVLEPDTPRVVLYEKDPARGILFERALSSLILSDDEVTLTAVPYFFSDIPQLLRTRWSLNNSSLPQERGFDVTLRRPEESSGSSVVSFEAEHPEKFMQEAGAQATIVFE